MGYELEAVVIYDSILYGRGHMIRRWAESVQRNFVTNAKASAPKRSGELAGGIHGWVDRVGPRHLQTTIFSEAPHSLYVLGGTTGPIFPDPAYDSEGEARYLRLSPGNGYGALYRHSVSGQSPNDFFATAAELTARTHSSLRGFSPTYGY